MSSDLVRNAAGRMVPTIVNGQKQVPFQGVGKYTPTGRKAAPPVRSSNDYPRDGNKVTACMKFGGQTSGLSCDRPEAGPPCATAVEDRETSGVRRRPRVAGATFHVAP